MKSLRCCFSLGFGAFFGHVKKRVYFVKNASARVSELSQIMKILGHNGHVRSHTRTARSCTIHPCTLTTTLTDEPIGPHLSFSGLKRRNKRIPPVCEPTVKPTKPPSVRSSLCCWRSLCASVVQLFFWKLHVVNEKNKQTGGTSADPTHHSHFRGFTNVRVASL